MTLMVLPDGGHQPSTSGHQRRTGDSRMASAGTASKPEMYSRGVQTGFGHPSGSAADLQNLDICICGQAAEGICFCESLGVEACKLVVQKGCGKSRVAILLSIHEEFCRSARGDPIINTRRRGSAYGDIRLRRPKAAPPPTLPRPRAQSMIVRNSRAAGWSNDANVRRPQVSVKPKRSVALASNKRQKKEENVEIKAQSSKDKSCQEVKQEQCLKKTVTRECATPKQEGDSEKEEDGCLDQNSYVSKAWLLFHGCEKVKKNDGIKSLKLNDSQEKRLDDDGVECGATCASEAKRLDGETIPLADQSLDQRNDQQDNASRITGLTVSSVMKSDSNGKTSVVTRRKSVQDAPSDVKTVSAPCGKLETGSNRHPNVTAKCQESGSLFHENVVESIVDPRLCNEEEFSHPAASEDAETSIGQRVTGQAECIGEVPPSQSSKCKEYKNSENLDGCLGAARIPERMSCRDSGIGDDVSISELKPSVGPCVIVEDQAEAIVEAESNKCQNQDSLSLVLLPATIDSVTDGSSSTDVLSNSQLPQCTFSGTPRERRQVDSVLQVQDESLLEACAILEKTEDVSASVDSSVPLEISVHGIDNRLCEDEVGEGNICSGGERMEVELGEHNIERGMASCVASAVAIPDAESSHTSEHCVCLPEEKSFDDSSARSKFLSGANITLDVSCKFVSKLAIELPSEQCEIDSGVKSDTEVKSGSVTEKISKKPETKLRSPKNLNPHKVGMLRYLICQSPIVLCDADDSDFEDSDSDDDDHLSENSRNLAWLPLHILLKIFRSLSTSDLASLKCACSDFKWLIEYYDIKPVDSIWVEPKPYRNDPCMQCGKIRDPRGDVSLCRWHPKIYYSNGHIGRRWTCCHRLDEDATGCRVGLHNNNWLTSKVTMRSIPKPWRSNMWHLCSLKDVHLPDFQDDLY